MQQLKENSEGYSGVLNTNIFMTRDFFLVV